MARTRSFYGWGYVEDAFTDEEAEQAGFAGLPLAVPLPDVGEYELAAPRVAAPASLAAVFTDAPEQRLRHSRGRSYEDGVRMLLRDVTGAADLVAYPETEEQISAVLEWAAGENVAVVPYGGGSSVVGGVDTGVSDAYDGVVSLDMERFGQVLEVDRTSRAARIQAGVLGPSLEEQLRPHALTLRHFPQSFEFSTLGGWIATRAGGHYATLYTHIDDMVESVRMITPSGAWESRRLPASGAGPSPDRMVIGSEGTLGVITEAWMRLQDRPVHRASASVEFPSMTSAGEGVRALTQSALFPTNCRVLDGAEARMNGVGDGSTAILVLGFESADHPVDAWMRRALELVSDHGGRYDQEAVDRSMTGEAEGHQAGAAGQWRKSFLRAPYLRDYLIQRAVVVDTFESAITWDRFHDFYDDVVAQTRSAIMTATGRDVEVSCRLTHVYPDGAAPYFTYAILDADASLETCRPRWRDIKAATNEIVVDNGGTVTHHHAVGRDHRRGHEQQTPELFRHALRAVKSEIDPHATLNPGVLIDP